MKFRIPRRPRSHHTSHSRRSTYLKRLLRFENLEARRMWAVLTWDGEAGDDRWETAANWQGDVLPTAEDDVIIDVAGSVRAIAIESGTVTVRSIVSQEQIIVRGSGELTIAASSTSPASVLASGIELAPGRQLKASGDSTHVTILSASTIDGANLVVEGGAILALPGVTSYTNLFPGTFHSWSVDGNGSLLDLQNITTINGSTEPNRQHAISASAGGHIDLRRVNTFIDPEAGFTAGRGFYIAASGPGSQIDLSALTAIIDRSSAGLGIGGYSALAASGGGQILVPQLSSLSATELVFSSPIDLPALTSFTEGAISINGISLSLPLTNIDGTQIAVTGGGSLALPNVTSYTNLFPGVFHSWTVDGNGSLLDLQNITTINGSEAPNRQHAISASAGGHIDLRRVSTFIDPEAGFTAGRGFYIAASGPGSQIDLSALTAIIDRSSAGLGIGGYSALAASAGGQILVPQLSSLSATELVFSSPIDLPALTSFTEGAISVNGISVSLPLTNIDGTQIAVTGGGSLALPNVTSYTNLFPGTFHSWSVDGNGSLLDLQNITTINGSTEPNRQHAISASAGGHIDLRRVNTFIDPEAGFTAGRGFYIAASGPGSQIDLSALTAIIDRSSAGLGIGGYSALAASAGGQILVPQLNRVTGTEVSIDATSSMHFPALQSIEDGNIVASDRLLVFPLVTTLNLTGIDTQGTAKVVFPILQVLNTATQTYDYEVEIPNLNRLSMTGGMIAIQLPPVLLSLDLQGGELTINADTEVRESFHWIGGTLTGDKSLRTAPGLPATIGGSISKVLATTLINDGNMIYDGSGLVFGQGNLVGRLHNLEGRRLVMIGDGDIGAGGTTIANEIVNAGIWQRYGDGTTKIDVDVQNSGSLAIQQGSVEIGEGHDFTTLSTGTLSTLSTARLSVSGNFIGTSRSYDRWSTQGITNLNGTQAQDFEVMGTDFGASISGFSQNFAHRVLSVSGTDVRLVDVADNAPGAGSEALYVDSVHIASGASLNLNNLKVYARSLSNDGQILGGSITLLPDGGSLTLNSPVFGTISAPGEIDNWAFYGRAGQRVLLTVNPGELFQPAVSPPTLGWATLELLDPNGNLVASATSSAINQPAVIEIPELTIGGNYTVIVKSPVDQPDRTGNYLLTGIDAKLDQYPLVLNQTMNGLLESPASIDRWTFTGIANQQVRLQIQNSSFAGLRFKLTGFDGFVGFTDLQSDSELLTLPVTGNYQIEVDSALGGYGAYSFRLTQTQETQLALGQTYTGELQGEGFAQLFRFDIQQNNPLTVLLNSAAAADTEIYLGRGMAPTRQRFDFQSAAFGQTQSLVVPSAGVGSWYMLVYSRASSTAASFDLLVDAAPLILQSATPSKNAQNVPLNLLIQGGGFLPGTQVFLDANGLQQATPTSVAIDASTQLLATFDLSELPIGIKDVRVRLPDGTERTIAGGLEVLPPGTARLETRLIMPESLGRGASATLYLEYANTGIIPMAAPLLMVRSADPDGSDILRLSLDSSNLAANFWTSAQPDGVSSVIQIFASGIVPGQLQPGERVQVPIHYLGLAAPIDFSDSQIEMEVMEALAENSSPIDWPALSDTLKPSWMNDDAWAIVAANLQSQIGDTWGDYIQTLSDNAVYLARLGQRVTNASQLLNFEISQAIGFSPLSSLGAAIDLAVTSTGQDIQFGRTFATGLGQRYEVGPFGRGWLTDWQNSLSTENDGVVFVTSTAGWQRRFQPDSRRPGTFFSAPEDTGVLRQLASMDYLLTETDGSSQTFSADGQLKFQTDSYGNSIATTYAGNLLTRLTHSSGSSLDIVYNAAGRIVSLTDSTGRSTSYTYDAANEYLLSATTTAGTITYTYDTASTDGRRHALTSIADPTGVTQNYQWDAQGRLVSTSIGSGPGVGRIEFSYDQAGTVTTTTQTGESTQVKFDYRNQIARRSLPSGQYFNYSYDSRKRLVKISDATGRVQAYAYNRVGALVSETDANGNVTTYLTSSSSTLPRALVDANGNRTTYDYNAGGDVIVKTLADGTIERTTYDAQGNPIVLVNRRGQMLTRTFNAAGQVLLEQASDGTTHSFVYDNLNRLISSTGIDGTTTYTYNSQDLLTRVDYPNGLWVQYQYDAAGRRLQLSTSVGTLTNTLYDSYGRLNQLRDQDDALIVTYAYDALNRVIREDKGNGNYTLTSYDSGGRIASIATYTANNTLLNQFVYTYNLQDQRVTTLTLDGQWAYAYDSVGQLIRAEFTSSNPAILNQLYQYQYDRMGNRTQTIVNGVATASIANSLNQINSIGTTNYQYDADGNLIRIEAPDGISVLEYDARNQLTAMTSPAGSWNYRHDPSGYRTSATINGVRTNYLIDYANAFHVIGELDANLALVTSYTFGLGLESMQRGGSRYFYDFDALGATSMLTGASGSPVNRYVYAPFGDALHQTSGIPNQFTFVGQFGVLAETNGLHFMQARYYASTIGQFLTEDPIELAGGDVNLRRYVGNAVTNHVDPEGTRPFDLSRATGGKIPAFPRVPTSAAFPNNNRTGNLLNRIVGNQSQRSRQNSLSNDIRNSRRSAPRPGANNAIGRIMNTSAFSIQSNEGQSDQDQSDETNDTTSQQSNWLSNLFFGPIIDLFTGGRSSSDVAESVDPNEKLGAVGYGPPAFIPLSSVIPYTVNFENLGPGSDPVPTRPATAPAQRVEIIDQLSPLLDWSSFEFDEFGFGDTVVTIESSRKFAYATLSLTQQEREFELQVELDFNPVTGTMRALFQSIDPLTELPPDVLTGFLPPEDGTGRGQGYIAYSVRPRSDLTTGTELRNIATIIFDGQTAIDTNQRDPQDPSAGTDPDREARNTIDAGAPQSQVTILPSLLPTAAAGFEVAWSGQDDVNGSGIASYDIYVSVDNGPFTVWLRNTVETSALYPGQAGRTYAFYSVARDNVGNVETDASSADAQTSLADFGLSTSSANENLSIGSYVADLQAMLPDGVVFTYQMVAGAGSTDNASFALAGNTLQTTVPLDYETKNSYSIRVRASTVDGFSMEKRFTISITDLAEVSLIRIDNGTNQRSLVRELVVTFDGAIEFQDLNEGDAASRPFQVRKRGSGGDLVNTLAVASLVGGNTIVRLTFSGNFTESQGSLVDGNYDLVIHGHKISRNGLLLDGNQDGTPGGDAYLGRNALNQAVAADKFFRLLADADGDAVVSNADLLGFNSAYRTRLGDARYSELFDFDLNAIVDNRDLLRMNQQYRKRISFT